MKTALITGANRGLGLETCRQLLHRGLGVVLTARSRDAAESAAAGLTSPGPKLYAEQLDVASDDSVRACAERLADRGLGIDVLVNNAGVYGAGGILDAELRASREVFEVNLWGAWRTSQAFVPGMRERGYGRVVNVSSGYGAFSQGLEGPAGYAISKAALNALTVKLAREAGALVKVNAVCPGWVRTRMGGGGAPLSVEEGAQTVVWLATLPGDGPTGGFFQERQPVAW